MKRLICFFLGHKWEYWRTDPDDYDRERQCEGCAKHENWKKLDFGIWE